MKQISYNITPRKTSIKYIVIHDTGNKSKGANAEAHYKYFNGGNRSSSADFFVDDIQALQVNDYNKYFTWHCGDGKGKYGITNQNSIGIEICINSDGDYEKAVENTVKLTKQLMKDLNIPIERVVRHYDASKKVCPAQMSQSNWEDWKQFKNNLVEEEFVVSKLFHTIEDVPDWGKPTVNKLIVKGFLKGTDINDLSLDESMLRVFVILDRAGVLDK